MLDPEKEAIKKQERELIIKRLREEAKAAAEGKTSNLPAIVQKWLESQ